MKKKEGEKLYLVTVDRSSLMKQAKPSGGPFDSECVELRLDKCPES